MQAQEKKVIYHNRWKMLFFALGSLILVAAAIPVLLAGFQEGGRAILACLLLSAADILFFGVAFLWSFRRLCVPTPALIIDTEGLYEDASVVGAGFVSWDEIASVHVPRMPWSRVLCLVPKDVDAFLKRQPMWKRGLMRQRARKMGAPIVISAIGLPLSFQEVRERVEQQHMAVKLSIFRT